MLFSKKLSKNPVRYHAAMPFYPEYEKISGFAPEAARECTTVLDRANDQQGPIIFHNPDKKRLPIMCKYDWQ